MTTSLAISGLRRICAHVCLCPYHMCVYIYYIYSSHINRGGLLCIPYTYIYIYTCALCTLVGNAAADGLKSVNDNIDGPATAVQYYYYYYALRLSNEMGWISDANYCAVCKKKSRAYTGSRLMSVSAWGRVSFFARYRRRPKIGKSRSPPGGVRLFGPLDRRFAVSRCLLAAGQFGTVGRFTFFPLFLFFYFLPYTLLLYLFVRVPFVSPLYFRAKGRHVHYAELAMRVSIYIYIYTPNMYMCTRRSTIFKGPWKPSVAKGTLIFRNYTTGRDLFSSGRRCRESHRYKRTRRWWRIYKGDRIPEVDTYNITVVLYISLYTYTVTDELSKQTLASFVYCYLCSLNPCIYILYYNNIFNVVRIARKNYSSIKETRGRVGDVDRGFNHYVRYNKGPGRSWLICDRHLIIGTFLSIFWHF